MMRDDRSNLGEIWMNSSEKPQELGQQKFSTPAPIFGLWIWGIVWGSKNLGIPSNIKTIYRYTDAKKPWNFGYTAHLWTNPYIYIYIHYMEHKKHTNSTKINICTWTPICIVVFCKRGSVLKFLRDRMSMCSSLKVFEFLEFMHSKWARRQLPGTVTKWSKFHQITMNMENWSTQNYQTNFFSICGRFRKFALVLRFLLRSFRGLQFVWLGPKKMNVSRLAQIALQGPCTMQNWKKNMRFLNRRFVRVACSRNLWSIFEMWYELQMHKKEMLRTRLQVNTQYMCIYI